MKAHCLFEQSGTFKNEFKKLGIDAFDYDIQNEYGETDYQVDLFEEICNGYKGKIPSIFDTIEKEDVILAFFPCTRFDCQFQLWMSGNNFAEKNWSDKQKLEYAMGKHEEQAEYYDVLCKLVLLCINRGLRLVIENPYNQPHYLTMYFPLKPTLIDKDRTLNGDYYKKPTHFWFINMQPTNNVIFEPIKEVPQYIIGRNTMIEKDKSRETNRSTIHPQYANRFIRQFIL